MKVYEVDPDILNKSLSLLSPLALALSRSLDRSLPQWLSYVREHGVLQFIHTYNQRKERSNEKLLWGEELEYPILKIDTGLNPKP